MEQAEAVWSSTHIGERQDEEHSILLYQIDNFHVEVFYHREDDAIRRLRNFSNTDQLQPYFNQIDIKELTQRTTVNCRQPGKNYFKLLIRPYRRSFNITDDTSDKAAWFRFIIMLVLIYLIGISLGRLLAG